MNVYECTEESDLFRGDHIKLGTGIDNGCDHYRIQFNHHSSTKRRDP